MTKKLKLSSKMREIDMTPTPQPKETDMTTLINMTQARKTLTIALPYETSAVQEIEVIRALHQYFSLSGRHALGDLFSSSLVDWLQAAIDCGASVDLFTQASTHAKRYTAAEEARKRDRANLTALIDDADRSKREAWARLNTAIDESRAAMDERDAAKKTIDALLTQLTNQVQLTKDAQRLRDESEREADAQIKGLSERLEAEIKISAARKDEAGTYFRALEREQNEAAALRAQVADLSFARHQSEAEDADTLARKNSIIASQNNIIAALRAQIAELKDKVQDLSFEMNGSAY